MEAPLLAEWSADTCQPPAYSHGPKQIFVFNKGLYLDCEIIKGTLCYPTTLWGILAGTEHFLLSCRWLLIHAQLYISILVQVLPFAQRPLSIIEIQCSLLNKTFFLGLLSRHKAILKMSFDLSPLKPGLCHCPKRWTPNWVLILLFLFIILYRRGSSTVCFNLLCVFQAFSDGMRSNSLCTDL